MANNSRSAARVRRHHRLRQKLRGTAERPRLAVFRSLRHITAQAIDDLTGRTLAAVSTTSKEFQAQQSATGNQKAAETAGKLLAERLKAQGVEEVVFDRGGYIYHGRIKAFAEGAREGGLRF